MQRQVEGLPGVAPTRGALALAIIGFQSIQVSESFLRVVSTPIWLLEAVLYPALFAISGFLLAQSSERHSARVFLVRRARRLLPALLAVVLLSALLLGPAATTRSLESYVVDPEFGLYFLNMLAWPQFTLPGVFQFNNIGAVVNLPLWLSPLVVVLLGITALLRRFGTLLLVIAMLVVLGGALVLTFFMPDLAGFSGLQRYLLDGSAAGVMLAFLFGALAYRLRYRLPVQANLAYLAAGVMAVVALVGNRSWLGTPVTYLLLTVPAAYLALYLCLQLLPLAAQALRLEPYLLGFLLFSFPVQQLWIAFGPLQQPFLLNYVLALTSTALLVVPLWHLVQRRLFRPDADDPRFGAFANQSPVRMSRQEIVARLPAIAGYMALALVLFILAIGIMALTFLAFQPESGGV